MFIRISTLLSFTILFPFFCYSAEESDVERGEICLTDSTQSNKSQTGLKGFINKVIRYFEVSNDPHPEKKFDISFIGGPHYSQESGFGIGIVGSGIYYSQRDSVGLPNQDTPPSNVSLKLDVTTGQLYKISAEGFHIFKKDRFRANYDIYFYSFKDHFWGIGYDNANNNANKSVFSRLQSEIRADFVINFADKLYLGPMARFCYINATRVDRPELFDGQMFKTYTTGLGLTVVYDTRDMPLNAYRGVYFRLNQLFNPRFMGNTYAFSESEVTLAGYTPLWKGGVLAAMIHADITYGNTPWGMMPTFGGSERMRGYYEGRYRDKCETDITVELRQHVWRRNGLVVWIGAGKIYPKISDFNFKKILPNAGIGYRWEFKPRINVRLDLGIGKGDKGIYFSLNEAF